LLLPLLLLLPEEEPLEEDSDSDWEVFFKGLCFFYMVGFPGDAGTIFLGEAVVTAD
jgi:hypothetical protein